jgi:hypothetical protein
MYNRFNCQYIKGTETALGTIINIEPQKFCRPDLQKRVHGRD